MQKKCFYSCILLALKGSKIVLEHYRINSLSPRTHENEKRRPWHTSSFPNLSPTREHRSLLTVQKQQKHHGTAAIARNLDTLKPCPRGGMKSLIFHVTSGIPQHVYLGCHDRNQSYRLRIQSQKSLFHSFFYQGYASWSYPRSIRILPCLWRASLGVSVTDLVKGYHLRYTATEFLQPAKAIQRKIRRG